MVENTNQVKAFFSIWRILIPVIIGLGVVALLFYFEFDSNTFRNIDWGNTAITWLFVALILQIIRDLAYMYRIRLLTDKQITWKRSFFTIMLWEFASSITPSIVGGAAIALYIVNKEGINMGRTTAVVMITSLLDELFYIVFVPIIIFIVGFENLFLNSATHSIFQSGFGSVGIFIIGYVFIVILSSIILIGIFFKPQGFKTLLVKIFQLRFLQKWGEGAAKTGDQIITTSKEMKGKSLWFWTKAYLSTVVSWTARFWMVNFLILAFVSVNDHLLIYARQLVMWVILLISPTPGGSGAAEIIFTNFLNDFIPQGVTLTLVLAFLWRIMSYYPYLIIGVIILPGWIKRVYRKK